MRCGTGCASKQQRFNTDSRHRHPRPRRPHGTTRQFTFILKGVDQELKGKTALVTGASRGIGAATAIALANCGVSRLILHYNSYKPDEAAYAAIGKSDGSG